MNKNKALALVGALIFSILFSLIFKWAQTGNPFIPETILFGVIVFLNIVILGFVGYITLNKFSGKSTSETRKHIVPSFLLFVILALAISLSLVSIGVYSFYLIRGLDTSNFVSHLFKVELMSAIKQFSAWILISSAFFFYFIWRKAIEREQHLRVENLKYKYQNLKSQVNPHFLFNSLNTLSEIVYEDAKRADNYIQKLSKMYRYILDNEETDLISLNKELEFVQHYIELQKVRDNDKILFDIDIQDTTKLNIIPVSLQILVENALKHNSKSVNSPLRIQIKRMDNYLIVANNVQKKNKFENTSKKGLKILQERVKLIHKKELIIKEENNKFVVKLPFIHE